MHVLILVMSARKPPYGSLMDAQMQTWDSEDHPQTHTIYYCGGQSSCPFLSLLETSTIFYSGLTEELHDVSRRTIEAFEIALGSKWDYMARPHSSTYVHKRNLVAYCETLPNENVVCGCMTTGDGPYLWGGCHYLFSRDVVERMVERKDKWNTYVMEDQSISQMVKELEIPVTPARSATINMEPNRYTVDCYGMGENFIFTDWTDINKAQPHFFFRVKQDLQRHLDVEIMHRLKEYYE